jgi:hypothetical protein
MSGQIQGHKLISWRQLRICTVGLELVTFVKCKKILEKKYKKISQIKVRFPKAKEGFVVRSRNVPPFSYNKKIMSVQKCFFLFCIINYYAKFKIYV